MATAVDASGVMQAGERQRTPLLPGIVPAQFRSPITRSKHLSAPLQAPQAMVVERLGDGQAFVAASLEMVKLHAHAQEIARLDEPVLLLGESGAGKKLLARLIHNSSPQATHRFACVRCSGVSEEALEAELFGNAVELSNGEVQHQKGQLELCRKGTLLLAEIEYLPARLQARLLDVFDQKQLCRPGDRATVKVDVRILASSGGDLRQAVACGKLRPELFHRLNSLVLRVPPLRERLEEIPALIEHILPRLARRYGQRVPTISPALLHGCRQHHWPGNFRELENFTTRFLLSGNPAQTKREAPLQKPKAPRQRKRIFSSGFSISRESAIALLRELKSA